MAEPIITVAELLTALETPRPPRVLDVRWRLDGTESREDYRREHIPGATYVDLETELSAHGDPRDGRHPLPALADFGAAVRRWGVQPGDDVVIVDGGLTLAAARAWWLLHGAVTEGTRLRVRVLDGGMPAWRAANGPVRSGEELVEPSTITVRTIPAGITIDEAATLADTGVLLDVRAGERYRGETEPLDPIAGHIPGAVNLPATSFFASDGTFAAPDEIRAAFDRAGADGSRPIAAYCGSGVTAAQAALAAALVDRAIDVFPGSWSAWSNTPGRPIATGAEPGSA